MSKQPTDTLEELIDESESLESWEEEASKINGLEEMAEAYRNRLLTDEGKALVERYVPNSLSALPRKY